MTTAKRVWMCIMAVVLVLSAVGIVSEFVFNGVTFWALASTCVWFMICGYWTDDFRRLRRRAKEDADGK